MSKLKDRDYALIALLLLLLWNRKSSAPGSSSGSPPVPGSPPDTGTGVTFQTPSGVPLDIAPEDGALSYDNGLCYRYSAADNSWYPCTYHDLFPNYVAPPGTVDVGPFTVPASYYDTGGDSTSSGGNTYSIL